MAHRFLASVRLTIAANYVRAAFSIRFREQHVPAKTSSIYRRLNLQETELVRAHGFHSHNYLSTANYCAVFVATFFLCCFTATSPPMVHPCAVLMIGYLFPSKVTNGYTIPSMRILLPATRRTAAAGIISPPTPSALPTNFGPRSWFCL